MKRLIARLFHGRSPGVKKTRTLTLFKAPRRRKPKKPELLYERPYAQA
jgi:hypothetical protein